MLNPARNVEPQQLYRVAVDPHEDWIYVFEVSKHGILLQKYSKCFNMYANKGNVRMILLDSRGHV